MGDSFSVVARRCAADECGQIVTFVIDAVSRGLRPGEQARAACPRCRRLNLLFDDGHHELAEGA